MVLFALPLAAFAWMGQFSRYAADDYCTAGVLATEGFLGTQAHFYTDWSGRFSFTFLIALAESAGAGLVPILPGLALLAWVAVAGWTMSRLAAALRWRSRALPALFLAVVVIFATLASTPDLGQSLYWQTGLITYLAPLLLLTGQVGWIADHVRREVEVGPSRAALVVGSVLAFIAGGTSETYAAAQTAALGLAVVVCWAVAPAGFRRRAMPHLIAGLAGAAIAMGIVMAAPGNAVRETGNSRPDLGFAVRSSIPYAVRFVARFVLRSPAVAVAAFLAPGLVAFVQHPRPYGPLGEIRPEIPRVLRALSIPAAVFLLLLACFLPSFYALGAPPPTRAQVIPQFFLVTATAAVGYLAGLAAGRPRAKHWLEVRGGLAAGIAAVLLAVAPLAVTAATLQRVGPARAYAQRWDAIDQQVRQAKADGATQVTVPALALTGNIGGFDFVGANPQDWFNQCVARYYGVDSVAAAPVR